MCTGDIMTDVDTETRHTSKVLHVSPSKGTLKCLLWWESCPVSRIDALVSWDVYHLRDLSPAEIRPVSVSHIVLPVKMNTFIHSFSQSRPTGVISKGGYH